MDNENSVYGSLASEQDGMNLEADFDLRYTTGNNNNIAYGNLTNEQDDLYSEADIDQHYTTGSQSAPYSGRDSYWLQCFQSDTSPWSSMNVGVAQPQTLVSSDAYHCTGVPNTSEESIQGSAESTGAAEPKEKNNEEDTKKKKKKKKSEKVGATRKGDGGHCEKDEKDGNSKKKDHGSKGHKRGHGRSGAAA